MIGLGFTRNYYTIVSLTTFDPLKKGIHINLTNGNKTATFIGGSGTVLTTKGKSSGKVYLEYNLDAVTAFQGHDFGIGNISTDIEGTIGFNVNSWGWVYWNGVVLINMEDSLSYKNGIITMKDQTTYNITGSIIYIGKFTSEY